MHINITLSLGHLNQSSPPCKCMVIILQQNVINNFLSLRLKDRLKEYHGEDFLIAEASQKVQKFMEWALACISFHYRRSSTRPAPISWAGSKLAPGGACEVQLRLSAFKFFLDLAGDSLSGKDFTEAFDAACFPLTLFSSLFDPGWSSGAPAAMIRGLLGLLVEWGADNVNQCFLEASRFGSTELVRILLQVNFTSEEVSCVKFFDVTI
jgi:hypothetical protein